MDIKYKSKMFTELYDREYLNYYGNRLKTIYLVSIIDMFLDRYINIQKDTVKISSRIFKTLYGSNYKRYIEYLIDNEFIFLYKNYSTGRHSNIYKMTDKAKETEFKRINVNIPENLNHKIKTISNFSYSKIDKEIKDKVIENLYKIELEYNASKQWIDDNLQDTENEFAKTRNDTAVLKIKEKNLYYNFDTYGRFHSNFTNLKKEIRSNYLYINGDNLVEIDIKNSQPFFLYVLMKQEGFTDWNGFDKDVLGGKIYETLINRFNLNISRKHMKKQVYKVLFGRNRLKNKWNKLFYTHYPEIYNWIKEYKKRNRSYKSLSHKLQNMESQFIFNNIIPKIVYNNPNIIFITIHDSVMVQSHYYDEVKKIFDNELNKLII